ncbi:MAG TPA: hypothetical protein VJN21_14995 [Candidatus Acidoferrales bacterium]|nr:hypothetical protein [Candidatus Acidoferrales bacterium]
MNLLCRAMAAFSLLIIFPNPSLCQAHHQPSAQVKLGDVSFPVSCLPAVQAPFNQAVALLHSFAYYAAEQRFLEIAQNDPNCAMAHWGMAMSYYHQMWEPPITVTDLERGQREIEKAQHFGGASPREEGLIEALAAYYRGSPSLPNETRALAYQKAMATVAIRNPKDIESQIFYALALLSTASPADGNHVNQKRAAEILEPLFQKYPEHPGIAHYLIHAYDNPELARLGLPAARAYSQIAPSAPHALHMPSHIFTQLGLWQDSINSNTAARIAAREQGDIGEELHSMDYLMYAYLQAGRYAEATRLLQELRAMQGLPVSQFKVGYSATAMPVRFAMERRQWAELAAVPRLEGALPQVVAISYWARTIGLARADKPDAAAPDLAQLKELLLQVRAENDDYWAAQVEIQLEEAEGWVAHAKGQQDEALSLLRSAAQQENGLEKRPITPGPIVPAREQLGDLLLELTRGREALQEFETSLEKAPRRRRALSGAIRAAELSGDRRLAEHFKSEFSTLNEDGRQ